MDWTHGAYTITTDVDRIDRAAVRRFLAASYWAPDRPADVIDRSLDHSLTFGLFHDGRQVGMARVVTDYATFAWVCDVFIEPAHRDLGLGRWLMSVVTGDASLRGLRTWLLSSRDAQGLYGEFGFKPLPDPTPFMIRRDVGPGSEA